MKSLTGGSAFAMLTVAQSALVHAGLPVLIPKQELSQPWGLFGALLRQVN